MSLINDIADLMLREGDIKAREAKERIAAEEEQRRNKHRWLKMTLKGLATFGPMFIPGVGPLATAARIGGSVGGNMASNYLSRDPAFLDPSQNPDLLVQRNNY